MTMPDTKKKRKLIFGDEARLYGYKLKPGWGLSLDDKGAGTLVPPEEITPEDQAELPEYATSQQVELLKKYREQGTLGEKGLTRPLTFTTKQAKELGIELPKGEEFTLEPTEEGRIPTETLEVEIPEVVTLFREVFPERFELTLDEEVLPQIQTFAYEDTETFLDELVAKGRTPSTENLLRTLLAQSIHEDTGQPYSTEEIDELVQRTFQTKMTIPSSTMTEVQGVRKLVKIDPDTLVARDLVGRTIGKYDPQTGRVIEQLGPPVSFAQPEKGWLDKVQELADRPDKLIPFVSSGVEIVELSRLMKTALDLEQKKEVSKEDLQALKAYVDRATMNTTWGYEVMDVISQLAPFAGELLLTAGIFSIGKTAVVKSGQQALRKIATKTGLRILEGKLAKYGLEVAGTIAGGTLQTLPAGATRIPSATLEKQLQATLTGDEESVWQSLAKAAGEAWVETVSERSGGLFTPLTSKAKGGLVKLGLFKAFQKANPGKSANDLKKIMERMGYNGVLNEMLEERVGDVMHGVLAELGLSDQKFSIPSLRQLSVELVSFSIPGVASKAVETMPKIVPAIREAIGEARAAPEAGFMRPGAEPRGEGEPAPDVIKRAMTYDERLSEATRLEQENKAILATPSPSAGEISPAQLGMMSKNEHAKFMDNLTKKIEIESRIKALRRTDEEIARAEQVQLDKETSGRIAQLERQIADLKSVGISPKTGKMRPSYQRTLEIAETELKALQKVPEVPVTEAVMPPSVSVQTGLPEPLPQAPEMAVTAPNPTEGATARVFGRIQTDHAESGFVEKVKQGWHKFNIKMVDDLDPVRRIVEQVKKGGTQLSIDENPYLMARLLRGVTSKATTFLEYGTFGKNFWKTDAKGNAIPNYTGESLQDILNEVKDPEKWRDFSTYVTARRSVELSARNIETGIEVADAQASIAELEVKYRGFEDLAKRLYKYQDSLLVYGQEMGLFSEELLTKLRKYGNYVPFYRVFNELQAKGLFGKKMANIASPIKKIKGSEREIINPLESIVKNTYVVISAADRNQVGIAIANLVDQNPELADVFERVTTPIARVAQVSAKELGVEVEGMTEAEEEQMVDIFRPSFFVRGDEVTVLIDGKKHYYRVDADLRDSLLRLDRESLGLLGKWLGAPARWLRAGATLSPDFMFRNPARDQLSAFAYSNYGFMPGIDFIKGMASILKKDKMYQLFRISGAEHSMLVSMDREYLSKTFKQIVEGKGFTEYVKHPMELFRIISELGEKATRLGEFRKGIQSGAVPLEAGYSARSVTLDFAQAGTTAQAINTFTAFFNANIRGWGKMISSFKEHPLRTSAKVFVGITLPSILLWLVNHDDDRWKEIPQWQKDLFWIVFAGDNIYRIPKPFELGIIFGSVPERFLDWLVEKDPNLMKDLAQSLMEAGSPGFIPTAGLPILEWMTNYSFFRGRAIVPESRETMPPELQYTQWTSEVSRKLGELLKLPPAQLDNLLFAWTGGLGRYATDILSGIMKGTGISPDIPEPSPTLADMPVIKAFVVRSPYGSSSEAVNDFYDLLEKYEGGEKYLKEMLINNELEKYEKFKAAHPELLFFADFDSERYKEAIEKGKTPRDVFYSASARYLRRVAGQMSELWKKEDLIYKDKNMPPEEKRRLIDEIEVLKTDIARKAVDMLEEKEPEFAQDFVTIIDELIDNLGTVIEEATPLSAEKAEIYDMGELSSKFTTMLEGITMDDLSRLENLNPIAVSYVQRKELETKIEPLINKKVYNLEVDLKEGYTFEDYFKQWGQGFIPNSPLNNLSRRQINLLRMFKAIEDKGAQASFLKSLSPDERKFLSINPYKDYLENNPKDNALLAIWGKAKLLTKESYDEFLKLLNELDIPDKSLPADIVPENLDTFLLKTSEKYREVESQLEEARLLENKIEDEEGMTAQERAVSELKATIIEGDLTFADTERKIEAIEIGTPEKPTSDDIIQKWIDRGKIIDEHGATGAEAEVWLLDNSDSYEWAIKNGLLSDRLDELKQEETVLRINVKYRKEDAEYNAIKHDLVAEQARLRREYMDTHPEYRNDDRRKEAYGLSNPKTGEKLPLRYVEDYVTYFEFEGKGFRGERFIVENPEFVAVMFTITGKDIYKTRAEDIPSVEYDDLYDNYKDTFDLMDSFKEPFLPGGAANLDYKDNTVKDPITGRTDREQAVYDLRHNPDGSWTEFGRAEIMRDGYYLLRGAEQFVDNYVEYYADMQRPATLAGQYTWYGDDRYLKEHPEFYREMKKRLGWTKKMEWDKIPTAEVERLYRIYVDEPVARRREDLRAAHRDLDAWLVITEKVSKPIDEVYRRRALTPGERFIEELEKSRKAFEESIK